jgi:nuclear pore complex protein Nup188
VNLSLVAAQTSLLEAWAQLAGTLAESVGVESGVQGLLVSAAQSAVEASVSERMDEPGAADRVKVRAEMVFVVMSKLVGVRSEDAGLKELLVREGGVWDLVRSSPVDYEVASADDDLDYYRMLLKILVLGIRPWVYMPLDAETTTGGPTTKPGLPAQVVAIMVEILTKTVAPGFRALCGNLHDDVGLALPEDFALITALLQGILTVRGISSAQTQLAYAIGDSSLLRSALSLYSWSDQLAALTSDEDPIYAEIAISTLVSLSSIPAVAETMATQGVLLQLSSANISQYFRKPAGKGQWDSPGRMFTIWTEGILPLCLSLLYAVGPGISGEASAFLNGFGEQLGRAEDAFRLDGGAKGRRNQHAGDVTLTLVRETRALVMIAQIIQRDVARAAMEGLSAVELPPLQYDLENAKAEVERLLRTPRALREKVLATSTREEALGAVELQRRVLQELEGVLGLFGEGA